MNDKSILFVDDDENLVNAFVRLFRKEGITMHTALSAEEGLETLETNENIHVIISDHSMPGTTGIDFLALVKDLHPQTIRVLITGHMDLSIAIDAINHGQVFRYLTKPVNSDELIAIVAQCFEQYEMRCKIEELTVQTQQQNEELILLNKRLAEINLTQAESLDVSQEILERLPVAVIGINPDLKILLTNKAAQKAIPALRTYTSDMVISDALPGDVVETIAQCISEQQSLESKRFIWDRNIINVMIEPLNDEGQSKGCILAFDIQELSV